MVTPEPKRLQHWFTLSNALTSMRLIAAPYFYWLIVNQSWRAACLIFWLAVASDVMDGRLARARSETSAFGGLLDHASDATFVVLGQMALFMEGWVPALLPLLIAAAFVQYALDSRVLAGHVLRASFLGRWNGILYFIPPGVIVTRGAFDLSIPPDWIVVFLAWALVVSTMVSMAARLTALISATRRNR